jgi:hypothetical protein
MIQDPTLPDDLNTALASESKDFVVLGKFAEPSLVPATNIVMGVFWLSFAIYLGTGFDFSNLSVEGVSFIASTLAENYVQKNYLELILPVVVFIFLFSIGVHLFVFKGLRRLLKKGGIFVGTPTKLYNYRKGQITFTNWEQYTGKITVKGSDIKGTLVIERNTGYMLKRKSGPSTYVAYTSYLSGISNVNEIAKIVKRRIAERHSGKYS